MSPFNAGIGQNQRQLVGENVQQYETAKGGVKAILPEMRLEWIDGGQHDKQLEVEYDWRSDEKEQRATDVGNCVGQD